MKGETKVKTKERLFRRSNRCHYCNEPMAYVDATLDHVIPKSKGGTDRRSNIVLACFACNQDKSDKMPTTVDSILDDLRKAGEL